MWMFTWKFTLAPRQKKKKKKKKAHFAFRFSGHLPETNLFFFLALLCFSFIEEKNKDIYLHIKTRY